ncbi:MAG TPA: PIN domain nuclease [Acidobacteria bacterium]|nr:PIN domain nuclease [Acidobacteriota bacterium]
MSVLVDSCVWSLAFRRGTPERSGIVEELRQLILDDRAVVLGPVRQEVLSGIRLPEQFETLRQRLRSFPDLKIGVDVYERAAEMFNTCRARGIRGSNTDFLICAAAERWDLPIFTTDRDFERFAAILPIRLHWPMV